MSLASGSQVGPYVVDREIGRGGMGIVYAATDSRLGRSVALKSLPENVAADPDRLARFEREARTLASVSHPNVAQIFGVEEVESARYLVLELVEGEPLSARLDRGAMPVDEAIETCAKIAAGVAAAHDAGVVHRDLKPGNVVITPEGGIKVLDFGLAKATEEGQSSTGSPSNVTATLPTTPAAPTVAGAVLGTPAYMSPEQARGRRVDRRTDIWAIGCILYECLTGAGPFAGETATDSIGAILHKEIDLARLPAETPPGVRRLIPKLLERDKERRLRDAGDVRIELESARAEPVTTADRGGLPGWAAALSVLAVLIALAAGFFGGFSMNLPEEPAAPSPAVHLDIVAPDGQDLLYVRLSNGGGVLTGYADPGPDEVGAVYVRRVSEPAWRLVPGSRRCESYDISPDDRWLAFAAPIEADSSTFRLMKMDLERNLPPVQLAILPTQWGATDYGFEWTPGNELIFLTDVLGSIASVDPESGAIAAVETLDRGAYTGRVMGLYDAIDADRILGTTWGYSGTGIQNDIVLYDRAAGQLRVILESAGSPRLGPDGSLLFSRDDVLFAAPFDASNGNVGSPINVAAGLRTFTTWDDADFDVANDGTLAYLPGGQQGADRRIVFLNPDGTVETWPTEPRAFSESIDVSRDGTRLVVTVASPNGLFEIWGAEIDDPRLRRLRSSPAMDLHHAVFTPDGESIVYGVEGGDEAYLEIAPFDSVGEPRRLEVEGGVGWFEVLGVHPDGDRLLMFRTRTGNLEILEGPLDGSEPIDVLIGAPARTSRAAYSPDGSMIAYLSDDSGRFEAYVRTIRDDGSLGPPSPVTDRGARDMDWIAPLQESVGAEQRLVVFNNEGRLVSYAIEPGRRPSVGEARPEMYDLSLQPIGRTGIMPGGRFAIIARGANEKPAKHAEIVLNGFLGLDARPDR